MGDIMTGQLTLIWKKASTFREVKRIVVPNLVLNQGFTNMAYLLAKSDAVTQKYYVENMQFGSGTTAPAADDATLQTPIEPVVSVTPSYPTDPTQFWVRFTGYLQTTQANGFPLSEAGLFSGESTPTLVARTTFASQAKDQDHVLESVWQINFL